jgi:hypothetical protein
MHKRVFAIVCLVLLAAGLAGCSKCGWFWEDRAHACHGDAPLTP